MKKFIFSAILVGAAIATTAFTFQNSDEDTSKKLIPCKKFYQTCPSGIIYYKCMRNDTGEASPDCYNVTTVPNNDGCNITARNC